MANLNTTFAGVKMRSPLGVSAMLSPTGVGRNPKNYADMTMRYVEAGAGYVYTAGTGAELESPLENLKASFRTVRATVPGYAETLGRFGIADAYIFLHPMNNTLETIRLIKDKMPPDVPIIGDIIGPGGNAEGWAKAAKMMEEAGVHMIELDPACVHPVTTSAERRVFGHAVVSPEEAAQEELGEMGIWPLLADVPTVLGPITEAVVKAVKVPVGVKLSPESGFPRNVLIMKVLARAGAKFVSSINGMISIAPPDIYNGGRSPYPFMDINSIGSASGPLLYPWVLKNIAAGAKYVPELDHASVGGIVHPRQVIELLMLGAKHVGLASAIYMTEGVKAIRRFTVFLERFMDEHGYENVDDLIGIGQKYIVPVSEKTDWGGGRVVASVDREKCTECGTCIQGYCLGALLEDKQVKGRPIIDEQTCGACGFCVLICPERAISLVERKERLPDRVYW